MMMKMTIVSEADDHDDRLTRREPNDDGNHGDNE